MNEGLGAQEFQRWSRIEAALDVRALLRDAELGRHAVLVLERDATLEAALKTACACADRWERRARVRALAGRLARQTVRVSPKVFAALRTRAVGPSGAWKALLPGQYDPVCGITAGVDR